MFSILRHLKPELVRNIAPLTETALIGTVEQELLGAINAALDTREGRTVGPATSADADDGRHRRLSPFRLSPQIFI